MVNASFDVTILQECWYWRNLSTWIHSKAYLEITNHTQSVFSPLELGELKNRAPLCLIPIPWSQYHLRFMNSGADRKLALSHEIRYAFSNYSTNVTHNTQERCSGRRRHCNLEACSRWDAPGSTQRSYK
jgi:hypothetical protein